jgi:DNA invertase Pin-like site-specific DNA recombinase
MSELIGYARVSSRDQNLDSQLDMLKQAGCTKIFADKTSGVSEVRPEWNKLMEYVRPGDVIVVAELSRMTRSLTHLLQLSKELDERKINIKSLRESLDTTTASGRAFFLMMGVINQLERELKNERAAAGRSAAKARGRSGGRPKTDRTKLEQALILYDNSDYSADEVCKTTGVGRRTFFRFLNEMREAELEAKQQPPPDIPHDAEF